MASEVGKSSPRAGQRWISETEPDLGLGRIEHCEGGRVSILFAAAQERRLYALASAPLRRAVFRVGDRVRLKSGGEGIVSEVVGPAEGLVTYRLKGQASPVPEDLLADNLTFSQPQDRLSLGRVDPLVSWDLRAEAWQRLAAWHRAPERGLIGARVGLIPHQLAIASEATTTLAPRLLLADEVGLGKTIEAGLIIHQLHHTGRATRVLILVPEPLIHQWFVEMLRRFNLLFSLYDEERCIALLPALDELEPAQAVDNPFLDRQLVLCATEWLADSPERRAQAVSAGWDVLVIDEAHRLAWTPESPSPAYSLAEDLATDTPSVLLLTATPQQLGPEGHFARLRLLDPARYTSLEAYRAETERYQLVAGAIDHLEHGRSLTKDQTKALAHSSSRVQQLLALASGDEAGAAGASSKKTVPAAQNEAREALISALADEFGPGRVIRRHTRQLLTGFPARQPQLIKVEADASTTEDVFTAKVRWLADLTVSLGSEKILVIGQTRALAEKVVDALRSLREINIGLFHEGLTLLQRDRNAAWFAEEEDGAQVLVCSEIGSEGRNFQFAHHLVLMDLPTDPDVLEQRIGRLDRIGQTRAIHIHVPWVAGTSEALLARWYSEEGLNALRHSLRGSAEISKRLRSDLEALLGKPTSPEEEAAFLAKSQIVCADVHATLSSGLDRLLTRHTQASSALPGLLAALQRRRSDSSFQTFAAQLFDHFGLYREIHSARSFVLSPGQLTTTTLAALPEEGLTGTFDPEQALSRDEQAFLTEEHPLIRGAVDLLLSSPDGNAAMAEWKAPGPQALLLELRFIVDCAAPVAWSADRWLPPTPVRLVFDHTGKEWTTQPELQRALLADADLATLCASPSFAGQLLPKWLSAAELALAKAVPQLTAHATEEMRTFYQGEAARLSALAERNPAVDLQEIATLIQREKDLSEVLSQARSRLDAVRLILKKPAAA